MISLVTIYKAISLIELLLFICFLFYHGFSLIITLTKSKKNLKIEVTLPALSDVDIYANLQKERFLKTYINDDFFNDNFFNPIETNKMYISSEEGSVSTEEDYSDLPDLIPMDNEEDFLLDLEPIDNYSDLPDPETIDDYSDLPDPETIDDYSDLPDLIPMDNEEDFLLDLIPMDNEEYLPDLEPIDDYTDLPDLITTNSSKLQKWNENIRPIFYDRKEFNLHIKDNDNALEKEWISRKLIENTPRGNIIMHYDVFNEGFVYYCDQSGISYTILNAVAMKYVITFRCRDFFKDETAIPTGFTSPFIRFALEEEKLENDKKKNISNSLTKNTDSSPFAKLKTRGSNPIIKGASSLNTISRVNKEIDIIISKNRFLCKGKIQNCDFIQKTKIKNPMENINCADKISYKDYKKSRIESSLFIF